MKCDELKPIDLECNMGKDINGVEHREPWKAYDIDEVNAAIAELKAENKKLKASSEQIMNEMFSKVLIYPHEMVSLEDAYKLAVSLKNTKRALWLARALALSRFNVDEYLRKYTHCDSMYWNDGLNTFNEACKLMQKAINKAEAICRAKAEECK